MAVRLARSASRSPFIKGQLCWANLNAVIILASHQASPRLRPDFDHGLGQSCGYHEMRGIHGITSLIDLYKNRKMDFFKINSFPHLLALCVQHGFNLIPAQAIYGPGIYWQSW